MPIVETFFGYVETTKDSLLLLEACRQGSLPRVQRRLQEQERQLVKSGAIFCFDEKESGIKRWTDGIVWSPSRILGNFLIYRELDDRKNTNDDDDEQDGDGQLITSGLTLLSKRQRERSLVGSLRNSYRFKPNGLVKKSMSIIVNGVHQHLVSYYNKEDILANKFQTPTETPELASIEISTELLCGQNFRIPFFLGDASQNTNSLVENKGGTNKRSATKTPIKQKRPSSSFNQRRYSNNTTDNNISSPSPSITSGSSSSYSSDLTQEESVYATTPNDHDSSPVSFSMNNQIQMLSTTNQMYSSHSCDKYQPQQQDMFPSQITSPIDCFYLPSPSVTNHHESHPKKRQRSQQTDFTEERYPLFDCHATSPPDATKQTPNGSHHLRYQKLDSISPMTMVAPTTTTGSDAACNQHWIPHSFSTGYSNERLDQNPHQYLFSSTSFHSINHAAIPTRTTELTSNGFMLDTNGFLGSGWNDFEMQM